MTARDAGGITAKGLAVYVAVSSMPFIVRAIDVTGIALREHDFSPWVSTILGDVLCGGLYIAAALLLWARAQKFWASDGDATSQVKIADFQRLALFMLGAYLFLLAAPEGLYVFTSSLQSNLRLRLANPDDTWRAIGHMVIGAILVATNWPRSTVAEEQPDSLTAS